MSISKKVLVIYSGGTIGMKESPEGYKPKSGYLEQRVRSEPSLCEHFLKDKSLIVLPFCKKYGTRILYKIYEYNPLLDSTNMDEKNWIQIAKDVEKYYNDFDGFVIIHGTDTMCYTASALSFMLESLNKSVVITGSQIPLAELRNDGRDNLLGALLIAGNFNIPQVTIFFDSKLFRGNRCIKYNCLSLDAFYTPDIPPLAVFGVNLMKGDNNDCEFDIKVDYDSVNYIRRSNNKLISHYNMVKEVGILHVFPGITQKTLRAFLQPPMKGVVLLTFGVGNFPDDKNSLIDELKSANKRGVLMVNCTQCVKGSVTQIYATGGVLHKAGVVQGADMTPEAALTKISYLLGREDYDMEKKKKLLQENLCGELTECNKTQMKDSRVIKTIANALHVDTSEEIGAVRMHMFPPLMCMAAAKGDNDTLEDLRKQGGDFTTPNYDDRTPLHVACCAGHLDTVKLLLENGASVHARDKFDCTPLTDAIRMKKFDVIKTLVQYGAHLKESSSDISFKLCRAAAEDDVDGLYAWHLAGADLYATDHGNRTAIQVAKEKKSGKAIEFLLKNAGIKDGEKHDDAK